MFESAQDFLIRFWETSSAREWAIFFTLGFVIEYFVRTDKNQPFRDYLFNVKYSFIYAAAIFIGAPTLNVILNQIIVYFGGGWVHLDLFNAGSFVGQLGAAATALFVSDFFYYWWHRSQHMWPWLWDQHALHHSDESVNASTSIRHHWSEFIFQGFVVTLPMLVIFKLTPVSVWTISMIISAWSWLIHMNVNIHLGRFAWLVAGPQLHRIHHSAERQHYDKNFAAYFPIWDVLFGTYYHPALGEFPRTGIPEGPPKTIVEAALFPFPRWAKRLAKFGQAFARKTP